QSARRAAVLAVPFAYGASGRGRLAEGFGPPGAYAGAILFPLAWAGLLTPGRRGLRASLAVLGLLGAAFWARLAGVTDAFASLPLFRIGLRDSPVFAAVFAVAVLAALGAERISRGEGRVAFLCGAAAAAAAIAAIYVARRPWMRELGLPEDFVRGSIAWELV